MDNDQLQVARAAVMANTKKRKVFFVSVNILGEEKLEKLDSLEEAIDHMKGLIALGYNVNEIRTYEGEEVDIVFKFELDICQIIVNNEVFEGEANEPTADIGGQVLQIRSECGNCKYFGRKPPPGKMPGVVLESRQCKFNRMNKKVLQEWRRPTDSCEDWVLSAEDAK